MASYKIFCMLLGEFVGTFTLIFIGCMGCMEITFVPDPLLKALHFGMTVMMIIQTVGHFSYAIINPAVTIAAVTNKLISIQMGFAYAVVQCVAACTGYAALIALSPKDTFSTRDDICMTLPLSTLSTTQIFVIEFLITFLLVCAVCGVWDPRNKKLQDSAPLKVGLIVAALSLAGGPYTGASMNPARSLGPALWNWNWTAHWVYWAGPLSGGFAASFFYKMMFQRDVKIENPDASDIDSDLIKAVKV